MTGTSVPPLQMEEALQAWPPVSEWMSSHTHNLAACGPTVCPEHADDLTGHKKGSFSLEGNHQTQQTQHQARG